MDEQSAIAGQGHLQKKGNNAELANRIAFFASLAGRYPQAVSLAAGLPDESLFEVEAWPRRIEKFVQYVSEGQPHGSQLASSFVGQYCRTEGFLCKLLAESLSRDEERKVLSENIIVTNGCQEALFLTLSALFKNEESVLYLEDPGYFAPRILSEDLPVEVCPVPVGTEGLDLQALESSLRENQKRGIKCHALYTIPDYSNPLGQRMSLETRKALIELSVRFDLMLIEDATYCALSFDGVFLPTLASLDEHGLVIHCGSLSKVLAPGLRLGYLLTPDSALGKQVLHRAIQHKSAVNVSASSLSQAVAGGWLLENDLSLRKIGSRAAARYKQRCELLKNALAQYMPLSVTWNDPDGGFFLQLNLPFEFHAADLEECARNHGVIVLPMTFFSISGLLSNAVRLSFSYPPLENLRVGAERFAKFIKIRTEVLE
jgi:(S)-3,5-dihydroxyphenylglycine transaminase